MSVRSIIAFDDRLVLPLSQTLLIWPRYLYLIHRGITVFTRRKRYFDGSKHLLGSFLPAHHHRYLRCDGVSVANCVNTINITISISINMHRVAYRCSLFVIELSERKEIQWINDFVMRSITKERNYYNFTDGNYVVDEFYRQYHHIIKYVLSKIESFPLPLNSAVTLRLV